MPGKSISETARIEQQACKWLATMNSDNRSDAEVCQFREWLAADLRHPIVYDELKTIWSELVYLRGTIEPESYRHPAFFSLPQTLTALLGKPDPLCRTRRPLLTAILASLLLIAIFAGIIFNPFTGVVPELDLNDEYATQIAEISALDLPDGTTVTLGAASAIEVDYGENERRIDLVSGEAFFSVVSDTSRPFIVTTADTEIRVVGTQFDVRRSAEGVRIAVLEGTVEVLHKRKQFNSDPEKPPVVRQILTSRQQLSTSGNAGAEGKPRQIVEALPGAWRNGRLIYEQATLSEVISDADRYYSGNILIDTDDLRTLTVSAAFRTSQIEEMMKALSSMLPVSVKKLSNGDIVLRRKETG